MTFTTHPENMTVHQQLGNMGPGAPVPASEVRVFSSRGHKPIRMEDRTGRPIRCIKCGYYPTSYDDMIKHFTSKCPGRPKNIAPQAVLAIHEKR